jgi:hypothetical protein
MLYNAQLDRKAAITFEKDRDRRQFIDNRDVVRLQDELMEAVRRRKVMSGEWTEGESHARIKAEVAQEAARQQENERELEQELKFNRESKKFLELLYGD